MNNHDIMNVTEVMEFFRCHRSTIYRLLKRGSLPGFKLGSDWRFRRQDIEAYMERFIRENQLDLPLGGEPLDGASQRA